MRAPTKSTKISVPLTDQEFKFLMNLASICKERDLLSGQDRKALFQGGRYTSWFPNRISWVCEILSRVSDEDIGSEHKEKTELIVEKLIKLDVELEELKAESESNEITDSKLFRLAEVYYEQGKKDKSRKLFMDLRDLGYDTEDLRFYLNRTCDEGC
jgi:hypothetical protein